MSDKEKALETELAALKAEKENDTSAQDIENLKAQVEQKDEIIRGLNEQVTKLDSVAKTTKHTVKHQGKTYDVVIPKFRHPETGATVAAGELKHDEKLIEYLLEIKSGVLREQTKD